MNRLLKLKNPFFVNGFPVNNTLLDKVSFTGEFHIICPTGLGNHFYDFSLAIKLHEYYPNASIVLWASSQHFEFANRLKNITIKSYCVNNLENSNFEILYSIDHVYKSVLIEINNSWKNGIESYIASAPFFPDGLGVFLGETLWECPYRVLGFSHNEIGHVRPFVPVDEFDQEQIKEFLTENDLLNNPYAVMTPHVVPMKAWGLEKFSKLATQIFEEWGIRTVFTGFANSPTLGAKGSIELYGVPLSQVAALIKGCRFYIGHDSGLTHMALSFSIPTLTVFVNFTLSPPSVRSPALENTSFVGPCLELDAKRSFEGVLFWVKNIINKTPLIPPKCFLCLQTAYFLLGVLKDKPIWVCACGTIIRCFSTYVGLDEKVKDFSNIIFPFPNTADGLTVLDKKLISSSQDLTISGVVLSKLDAKFIIETLSCSQDELIPSWEGILWFMQRRGYYPIMTSWSQDGFWWKGAFTFSKAKNQHSHLLPVGKRLIRIPSYDIAVRYYRSILWRDEADFSKLWKKLSEWHHHSDAQRMAIETFRLWPNARNFRNIFRAYWGKIVAS